MCSTMRVWNKLLVAKWRCMKNELHVNPEDDDTVIRTACLLHNIITDKEAGNDAVAKTSIAAEDHSNVSS